MILLINFNIIKIKTYYINYIFKIINIFKAIIIKAAKKTSFNATNKSYFCEIDKMTIKSIS